ncbi:MAG TPA: proline iminopeptidase-family hydrolase [Oligoflexia bacterium]|nr:proline iminopeptidase-family hydrolase [Oligoflexia bacterium]HMP27677.1 proline iminopeptidase-family hydrolase [Oligoflexia bacterium]
MIINDNNPSVSEAESKLLKLTDGKIFTKFYGKQKQDQLTLICIHGGPGFSCDYLEPLGKLKDLLPVVLYDQLGSGLSERPESAELYNKERFLGELKELISTLKINSYVLYGHSWGAALALMLAAQQPAGLKGLVLASPAIDMPAWQEYTLELIKTINPQAEEIIKSFLNKRDHQAVQNFFELNSLYAKKHLCKLNPLPLGLIRSNAKSSPYVYNLMWGPSEFVLTGSLAKVDLKELLPLVRTRSLVTIGADDEVSADQALNFCSLLKNATGSGVEIFLQSSHNPHYEEQDLYLEKITKFLNLIK